MKPKLTKLPTGQLILQNVRIAHPSLFEAKAFKGEGALRYSATVLVPKEATDVVDQLTAEINKIAKERYKLAKMPSADSCFTDGDDKANEAYHGHWILAAYAYPSDSAERKGAPAVTGNPPKGQGFIQKGDSNEPYSGCYANVLFDLYTPKNFRKVSCGLKVVQFVGNGPRIGASTDVTVMPELEEMEDGGEGFE